jgi:hypothetical protein
MNTVTPVTPSDKHILIVGGTGMLKTATLGLTKKDVIVSVIARSKTDLDQLRTEAESHGGHIHPIVLDYSDYELLQHEVCKATELYGPVSLAIIWIHDYAEAAVELIAELVTNNTTPCQFFHLRGSTDLEKLTKTSEKYHTEFAQNTGILYREVILGSMQDSHHGKRWLTHDEISQGVLKAINLQQKTYIIGVR